MHLDSWRQTLSGKDPGGRHHFTPDDENAFEYDLPQPRHPKPFGWADKNLAGGRGFNSVSGAKAPRTLTALAATTDIDSAEHKQLPKRRFSIKQKTMMSIWQQLIFYLSAHHPLLCLCLPPAPFNLFFVCPPEGGVVFSRLTWRHDPEGRDRGGGGVSGLR
jgi:hypothetical protein